MDNECTETEYKACKTCNAIKKLDNFHLQGKKKPRRADCDECRRKTVQKYRTTIKKMQQVLSNETT